MAKLFVLKRLNSVGWDEHAGFVVRAKDENEARQLAASAGREDWWSFPEQTSCEVITTKGQSEIILEDFNAG